ncbi:phosphate signaling complex protein PhoU [Alienimonas chondri]|uniref:Phosphate-specific transport system accessory protein PhoU n=1 Tax=Alienimonas chondri TaxID=2681879 RepID=A0ABX1VC08_9PLAN|nr:phosphate signaling complex protein PhoU [Alienimonas chondri]NNJ24966.1 Phosphate-specific transport system accessory protein PhoU [Alienimonas chondri]
MSLSLSRDMEETHRDILTMCALTEELVGAAVDGLGGAAHDLASELKAADKRVDWYDVQVEERCLRVLALHAPVAEDLRRVVSVLRIAKELERVADLGVHIAERADHAAAAVRAAREAGESNPVGLGDLPALKRVRQAARVALDMLRRSIDAYVDLDPAKARKVCVDDDIVDGLNRETLNEVTDLMRENPAAVEAAVGLFSVSRHIERIADHATNIAKDAIYLVEGQIVRHSKRFPDRRAGETAEERFGPVDVDVPHPKPDLVGVS